MSKALSDEDLVEAIYAGAHNRARLREALAAAIARIGATGGNIHIVEKRTQRSRLFLTDGPNYTDTAIAEYFSHWRHLNPYRVAMREARAPFLCHERFTAEDLANSPYVQDFYFRIGERWLAGAVTSEDPSYEVSLVFNRARGEAAFDAHTAQFIGLMLPHVRRATALGLALAGERASEGAIVDGLTRSRRPAWLLDGRSHIVWRNSAADAMARNSLLISQSEERLTVLDERRRDSFALRVAQAVSRQVEGAATSAMRLSAQDETVWLEILPATAPAGSFLDVQSLALVLARTTGPRPEVGGTLQSVYGLSVSESEIALAVAAGKSVDDIASTRAVSRETVRTQLRFIFDKAGVNRQADLARLVWTFDN